MIERISVVPPFTLGTTVWRCWVVDDGQRYMWRSECGRLAAWRDGFRRVKVWRHTEEVEETQPTWAAGIDGRKIPGTHTTLVAAMTAAMVDGMRSTRDPAGSPEGSRIAQATESAA